MLKIGTFKFEDHQLPETTLHIQGGQGSGYTSHVTSTEYRALSEWSLRAAERAAATEKEKTK